MEPLVVRVVVVSGTMLSTEQELNACGPERHLQEGRIEKYIDHLLHLQKCQDLTQQLGQRDKNLSQ